MKLLIPFLLVSLNSYPCFSMDLAKYGKELAALGVSESVMEPVAVPDATKPQRSGTDEEVMSLQAEALADPAKFIDEHTPEEVDMAFEFQRTRFQVTDPIRIEKAIVRLTVDLTRQRLTVKSPTLNKEFKISSGLLPDHGTPGSGKCYSPDTMETMHYSSLYNNAPMPHSVFFNGNIAVHATSAANEALLGQPASHGCVRLSRVDAKTVFGVISDNGKSNTAICVQGVAPGK
ncbi:MAG: L,D-transpeptidase [Elusimicrobiota bacterium]